MLALKRQGWSIAEIARELDYHPATISKWLKNGGPPEHRLVHPTERVIDDRWGRRIDDLIAPPSKLLATSVYEIMVAEGFAGSYPTVVRAVRARRGPRFRPAPQVSVPIETAPGEESQFDFSDCSDRGIEFGLAPVLWCFGAILCWSRHLFWWFTTSVDREHTFEGLVRHFEAVGGVPGHLPHGPDGGARDLPGAAVLPPSSDGRLRRPPRHRDQGLPGRRRQAQGQDRAPLPGSRGLVPGGAGRARCAGEHRRAERGGAGLAGRAGERPGALDDQGDAGRTAGDRAPVPAAPPAPAVRHRLHRAPPGPRRPAPHRVGRRALLGAPECLGQMVACRVEVDSSILEITWGGTVVASHRLADRRTDDVWDSAHRQAAEAAALGRTRPAAAPRRSAPIPRPAAAFADFDVELPDLAARYGAWRLT